MGKRKSRLKTALTVIALVIVAVGGVFGYGVYDYVSNVPKLTPKQQSFEAVCGQTVGWDELFDVQCRGEFFVQMYIEETDTDDAELSEGKDSIYVGSSEGSIKLIAVGVGRHSEGGKQAGITINVKSK